MLGVLVAGLLLIPGTGQASGQTRIDKWTPPLPTQTERDWASLGSWGTTLGLLGWDTVEVWNGEHRGRGLALEGARLGVTYGVAEWVKLLTHRQRPCATRGYVAPGGGCGLDDPDRSMYSLHAAFSWSTLGGPGVSVMVPMAVGTQGLRVLAGKHWLTDTLVGAGAGIVASRIR